MTSARFLRWALLAALAPALLALVLPSSLAEWYTKILEPGLLFASFGMALWVASIYRSYLKLAFYFLAGFLASYGAVNVTPFTELLAKNLGSAFLTVILVWQIATYTLLMIACVNILNAIEARRLNSLGKGVMIALALAALGIVAFTVPDFIKQSSSNQSAATFDFLLVIFDMLAMLMLAPVLLLYTQNAKAQHQESASFLVLGIGIVASLDGDYWYAFIRHVPLAQIGAAEFQKGSPLDALYIFCYLTLLAGLYAHRKHQEWSLNTIEKSLII